MRVYHFLVGVVVGLTVVNYVLLLIILAAVT